VRKKWGALLAVGLATFMLAVNFMAVGVALPAVRTGLGATFPQLEWALEAYVLALAVFVLTAGYVADREGRRPVFLIGAATFSVGSLLAGLAPSPVALIGGRVVQGLGGAALFATGPVLVAELFRDERAKAPLAIWGTLTGLALGLSPGLGGLVTYSLGWRWVLLLNVPIGAVAFLAGIWALSKPSVAPCPAGKAPLPGMPTLPGKAPRAGTEELPGHDWRGLALFTSAIAVLVAGLARTSQTSWSQSGALACFASSGLLLAAFTAVEATAPAPMLDISLFRRRTFTGAAVAAFGLSMAVLGPFMFLVLFLSGQMGYSVGALSLRLLVMTGMTLPFLPFANWFDRHLPLKALICAGLLLVAAGSWWMSRLSVGNAWSYLAPGFVLAGVGLELVNPRLASAAAATVKPQHAAIASRTSSALRQLGAAVGVAVSGSVFATKMSDDIAKGLAGLPQLRDQVPQIASLVDQGRGDLAMRPVAPGLRAVVAQVVRHSATDATHEVLLVAAAVAAASAVLALLVRSSDALSGPGASPLPAEPAVAPSLRPAPPPEAPRLVAVPPMEAPRPAAPPPEAPRLVAVPPAGLSSTLATAAGPTAPRQGPGEAWAARPAPPELPATLEVEPSWEARAPVLARPQGGEANGASHEVTAGDGRAHAPVAEVGHVFGAVSLARGGWLPGVDVVLLDSTGRQVARTTTDTAGSYHFSGVREGTYEVCAQAPGAGPVSIEVRGGKAVGADITLGTIG